MNNNIKSIKFIKTNGEELELSIEDCRLLYDSLSELFKTNNYQNPYPYPDPYLPSPIPWYVPDFNYDRKTISDGTDFKQEINNVLEKNIKL